MVSERGCEGERVVVPQCRVVFEIAFLPFTSPVSPFVLFVCPLSLCPIDPRCSTSTFFSSLCTYFTYICYLICNVFFFCRLFTPIDIAPVVHPRVVGT